MQFVDVERLSSARRSARSLQITKGKKRLITPTYFPAISGSQFNFKTGTLVSMIARISYPRMLISAYDFKSNNQGTIKSIGEVSNFFRNGSFVMLDSGTFEVFRLRDTKWSFEDYKDAIGNVDCDFYCTYDSFADAKATLASRLGRNVGDIERSVNSDLHSQMISILHGFGSKQVIEVASHLKKRKEEYCHFVAVPERDCGATLLERAKTILKIREILGMNDSVLHILGCGNPVAMAAYAYCGADTFDSLDWTEQVVDPVGFYFRDIAHIDVLPCNCKVCKRQFKHEQMTRALLHNLYFYQNFSLQMQSMIKNDTLTDFLISTAGKRFVDRLD